MAIIIIGCDFLFDWGDDVIVDDIFLLVGCDFMKFISLLFILCHHFIFFFYISLQLLQYSLIFLITKLRYFGLHSFSLPLKETVFKFTIRLESHCL